MRGSDRIGAVVPRPALATKRFKGLLDGGRLVIAASASKPRLPPRVVVVADEVDPPDHQRVTVTTR